jgi:hypothetical protein
MAMATQESRGGTPRGINKGFTAKLQKTGDTVTIELEERI